MSLAARLSGLAQAVGADVKLILSRIAAIETAFPATTSVQLGSDRTTTGTTQTAITGLSASVAANAVYRVDCFIRFATADAAAGVSIGYDLPVGAVGSLELSAATAVTWSDPRGRALIASRSAALAASAVEAANTEYLGRISGVVRTGNTGGAMLMTFGSGVAGVTATVKSGSELVITRVT